VTAASTKVLDAALALSEDERLDLAAELIASVDGPPDADWDSAWQAELERRELAAAARAEPAPEWSEVRARILGKLATR
jgi:putative addiction module component (TIGR02574 family)